MTLEESAVAGRQANVRKCSSHSSEANLNEGSRENGLEARGGQSVQGVRDVGEVETVEESSMIS